MLGSGLFVFAPSDQVILRAVTQSLKRPLTGLSHPESILRPTLGSSSLSGCPSTHSPLCPRASLTHSGPAPAQALQPPSPAPKPEVRAGDSGAESACAKVRPSTEEPPPEQAGGPSRARRTSGTLCADPFLHSRPLLPQQLSRKFGFRTTARPRVLCTCREENICLCGRPEGPWRRGRRIQGIEVRRGNDPRTALGSERVPRVHFYLEQTEWPPGTVRPNAGAGESRMGGPEPVPVGGVGVAEGAGLGGAAAFRNACWVRLARAVPQVMWTPREAWA